MDILDTKLEFGEDDRYLRGEVIKQAHHKLGAREPGYIHSPQYKNGVWDGIVDFYDPSTDTFPTGLIEDMKDLLGEMQAKYGFYYEIIDNRPDPFVYKEDMDKEIKLKDTKMGEITLRNYQYGSVEAIIEQLNGIVAVATNGGKCISIDSMVMTETGYKSLRDIFESQGVTIDSNKDTIDINYPLVNRYGKTEYTSHFTKNGIKPTKRITTSKGIELVNTYNHPLLIRNGFDFVWKNTEDIEVGDILVSRVGDNRYGTDTTVGNENDSYAIGCMIADSYLGSHDRLSFSNDQQLLLDKVSDFWKTFSNKDIYYDTHKESKGLTIHLHDRQKSNEFHSRYGIGYGVAKDKEIPKCIMESPKKIQLAFLSGYFECESSISEKSLEVTSASKKLLNQVQLLLNNMGIVSTLKEKKVKGYEQNY